MHGLLHCNFIYNRKFNEIKSAWGNKLFFTERLVIVTAES